MAQPTNDSVIGRLLQEISWEGSTVRSYRTGGSGRENVLTAEVLSALETLPRDLFLGGVIKAGTGAETARTALVAEVEDADVLFLGEHDLGSVSVQPDVELSTPSTLAWIEAKRLKPSAFGPNQLARQVVTLIRESGERHPLLITLTRDAPPVLVKGHGHMSLHEAVELGLEEALELRRGPVPYNDAATAAEKVVEQLPKVMAWVTWQDVADAVSSGLEQLPTLSTSIEASIQRQAARILAALEIHA